MHMARALFLVGVGLMCLLPATATAQAPSLVRMWGSYGTGNDQFKTPVGVAVDRAGNVFTIDTNNNRVQVFTTSGTFVRKWGSLGHGAGQFIGPVSIVVDPNGIVYVADGPDHGVQKFTATGTRLGTWAVAVGNLAVDPMGFFYAGGYWSGNVLYNMFGKFNSDGGLLMNWPRVGAPNGLAADADGNVYAADDFNERMTKYSSSGQVLLQWGSRGYRQIGELWQPVRVAVDAAGIVYVVDYSNCRVLAFTSDGVLLTQWGSPGSGPGQFANPVGIAVDAAGYIYVADTNNSRIQVFAPILPTPAQRTSWGRLKALYR
jgi:DNA-binding beta-propeller fold protein YncE